MSVFSPTLGAMQVLEPLIFNNEFTSNQIPKLPHAIDLKIQAGRRTGRSPPRTPPSLKTLHILAFCNNNQLLEVADLLTIEPSFLRSRCGVIRIGNN